MCILNQLLLTDFDIFDSLSCCYDNSAGLMPHDHGLFDNEVSNPSRHPVVDIGATDANRPHRKEHLCTLQTIREWKGLSVMLRSEVMVYRWITKEKYGKGRRSAKRLQPCMDINLILNLRPSSGVGTGLSSCRR